MSDDNQQPDTAPATPVPPSQPAPGLEPPQAPDVVVINVRGDDSD